MSLTWSRERPSEPGWYWVRGYYEATVFTSEGRSTTKRERLQYVEHYPNQNFGAMWEQEYAGPIPEPQEPER